jgi:hypothetical protein
MCGNFGLLANRLPENNRELLPPTLVEMFYKMGHQTEVRGEQAGGGLTLARNKDNQVVFVGKKLVNQKRKNLTKSLEAAFAPVRNKAVISGIKPLESTTIGAWHYRYGTSCPPSILETHWHEWMPARTAPVWQIEDGKWVCKNLNINHRITHNGDFDEWKIFGEPVGNSQLGWWLERVLHTPNGTTGDSPKIAGMMDLLITQGMWYASVRLAYQLAIATSIAEAFGGEEPAKNAPNTAPAESDLNRWAAIFDEVFAYHTKLISEAERISVLEYLNRWQNDVCSAIAKDSTIGHWTEEQQIAFVQTAIEAFRNNHLYRATQIFMSKAVGSFGLVTVSTLEPQRLVLSAKGQPIVIGVDRQQQYAVYASEPAAVDAVLLGNSKAYRLDLNQKSGEVALVSSTDIKLYSIAKESELQLTEIEKRWMPMTGSSGLHIPKTDPQDPVEADIKDIPQILADIQSSWIDPHSINRQSADYFVNLLIEKAKHFEQKQIKMFQAGLESQAGESPNLDLLIIGVESSLWLGQKLAQDLKTIFPFLNVSAISANQVLKRLKHDFSTLHLSKRSLVLAITQSGQTFSTVQAINSLKQLVRKGLLKEVFVVTGESSSFMDAASDRQEGAENNFDRRIFINHSGRRTAEAATIVPAAIHQTLTELLFYIAKRLRRAFPNSMPFGMTLTKESLLALEIAQDEFVYQSAVSICGTSTSGGAIPSAVNQKLIQGGRKWGLHVTETPLVWGIHALYTLITVGWVIPFGYTIPIGNSIFRLILWAASIPSNLFLVTAIGHIVTAIDIGIYIFGPWLWTLGLRYLQGRQLLARMGNRTVVIGDVPWVHQLLKSYVSKLFSLSYGITSLEVHGANPQDHMLHHFGHRVVRGTLVFLGVPDGRRGQKQQNEENATIMTGKQADGVRNMGAGPEVIVVGHNPDIARKGFRDAIVLWSNPDSVWTNQPGELDQKAIVEELRESRFSSFERLLSSYVFFWAMAKKVSSFPLLRYQHWKSQSRTKVMTTAAPVSGSQLDLPDWEEENNEKSNSPNTLPLKIQK